MFWRKIFAPMFFLKFMKKPIVSTVPNLPFQPGFIPLRATLLPIITAPATSLITAGQTIQEMTVQMERVEDVMKYPDDVVFDSKGSKAEKTDENKLLGHLQMKNVTFGYSKLGEPLLKDFSLDLKTAKLPKKAPMTRL